jgi:hypothetical protein
MKSAVRAVVLLLIASFFLFACSHTKPLSPSETIVKFDEANKKGDIKASEQYVDSNVLQLIKDGKAWWIGTYSNFITDYNKEYKKVTSLKKTEKINGDTATVETTVIYKDNSKGEKTYNLVKENNKWKITMDQ